MRLPPAPLAAAGPDPGRRIRRIWVRLAQGVVGLLALILLLSLAGGGAGRPSYRASGPARPLPAEQLAPVSLAGFDGILVGARGRPVVVNVWASWCVPCRTEMPLLQRASETYEGRVAFLGVDSDDDPGAAARFLDRVGVRYPNIFDMGRIRRALALRGFPTTYVFDRRGELRDVVMGGITEARLAAVLEDLLRT